MSAMPLKRSVLAGMAVALLVLTLRVAISLDMSSVAAVSVFALIVMVIHLSPPIAPFVLIYGWALFADSKMFGMPIITMISVWLILWLVLLRPTSEPLPFIENRFGLPAMLVVCAFLLSGVVSLLGSGGWKEQSVILYNVDLWRGWLGFLLVGILACRRLGDLKTTLQAIPFAFLIYPLTLPLDAWRDFFTRGVTQEYALGIGLSAGMLNTNVLGSAAGIASVVALACATQRVRLSLKLVFILLFIAEAMVGIMSGARQFVISWFVGLIVLGFMHGKRRGFLLLVALAIVAFLGYQILGVILPPTSGFYTRFAELTRPFDIWQTRSLGSRLGDFANTLETWKASPVFGTGFLYRTSHNLFLDMGAQTGIIGLLLFLAFCTATIWRFSRILVQPGGGLAGFRFGQILVPLLTAYFVLQNISGGVWGMDAAIFIVLLGSMLGIVACSQHRLAQGEHSPPHVLAKGQQLPMRQVDFRNGA